MIAENLTGCVYMTASPSLATSRERFLKAAQEELIAFERKEQAFRKTVRKERADELRLPVDSGKPGALARQ